MSHRESMHILLAGSKDWNLSSLRHVKLPFKSTICQKLPGRLDLAPSVMPVLNSKGHALIHPLGILHRSIIFLLIGCNEAFLISLTGPDKQDCIIPQLGWWSQCQKQQLLPAPAGSLEKKQAGEERFTASFPKQQIRSVTKQVSSDHLLPRENFYNIKRTDQLGSRYLWFLL